MQKFQDWVEKKKITESSFHNPMTSQKLGGNPFFSGLIKLQRGLQKGELDSGYMGSSIVANRFGLSQEEIEAMLKHKIVINNDYDDGRRTDINVVRLKSFLSQMPGQSPQPRLGQ